jgi:hypothetical protein
MTQSSGFLSPAPAPPDVASLQYISIPDAVHEDIVTGAPQRLFRYLHDSVVQHGYHWYAEEEPRIVGHAIGETGSTEGWLLGERDIQDVRGIYPVLRVVGLALLLLCLVPLVYLLLAILSENFGSLVTFGVTLIILAVAGSVLIRQHRFQSELVRVTLKGEVYKSTLGAGTRLPNQVADSGRASLISELRVGFGSCGILTENRQHAEAGYVQRKRFVAGVFRSSAAASGLQDLLTEFSQSILPKVVLQKSREQVVQEYGAMTTLVPPSQSAHQRFTKCGFCGTMNPEAVRACTGCGASLL